MNPILQRLLTEFVQPLVTVMFALAVCYFLFGVFNYIRNLNEDTKRTEGQNHMLYGVIGLAVMVSAIGIIRLIASTVLYSADKLPFK